METRVSDHQAASSMLVVLAGGLGRRMGGNKPLYPLQGSTLIRKVIDRLAQKDVDIRINAGALGGGLAGPLSQFGLDILFDEDIYAGLGPMSGVCTALHVAANLGKKEVITAPCDMPALPANFVSRLRDVGTLDCDVVHYKGKRDYPLCAAWSTRQIPYLLRALEASKVRGGLGVMKYLDSVKVRHVPVADDRDFLNVNTPEDLASVQSNEGHEVTR